MLTSNQLADIFAQGTAGVSQMVLAKQFGVTSARISQILTGVGKLARAQRDQAILDAAEHATAAEVAGRFGLTRDWVYKILRQHGRRPFRYAIG